MLPEAKEYLEKEGWNDQNAGLLIMGCFIGGFVGIQVVSRLLHQYMPSHVVDCDHTHEESGKHGEAHFNDDHGHGHRHHSRPTSSHADGHVNHKHVGQNGGTASFESTPLLGQQRASTGRIPKRRASARDNEMSQRPSGNHVASRGRATLGDLDAATRRSSIMDVQKRLVSFVKDTKRNCDELGSCYGYTDPCGQECFKHLSSRSHSGSRQPPRLPRLRTTTSAYFGTQNGSLFQYAGGSEGTIPTPELPVSPKFRTSRAASREPGLSPADETAELEYDADADDHASTCTSVNDAESDTQHHHHVPANAFLSIGLQTSIAIALHKFPEGFITYATNHANPALGFNVFMALFVHNISEGFAMCLPLYMALGSRWRAMLWSAILGGLSQPMGAGVAALWFKLAKRSNMAPNALVYACLFAVTSGIMVSVGLQLFVEGLSLNHNRNLCIFFGFLGMVMLGVSNALFAAH